jgi:hypothetical protein
VVFHGCPGHVKDDKFKILHRTILLINVWTVKIVSNLTQNSLALRKGGR